VLNAIDFQFSRIPNSVVRHAGPERRNAMCVPKNLAIMIGLNSNILPVVVEHASI